MIAASFATVCVIALGTLAVFVMSSREVTADVTISEGI